MSETARTRLYYKSENYADFVLRLAKAMNLEFDGYDDDSWAILKNVETGIRFSFVDTTEYVALVMIDL